MNIAIVGGGKGGCSILQSLSKLDDLNISIIIDKNPNAPGFKCAQELDIAHSTNINDIDGPNVDIIIEATGIESVEQEIHDSFGTSCKIISSSGAFLIMKMVENDIQTLNKLNAQMKKVSEATSSIQNQLSEITTSVNNVSNVSNHLISTVEISNRYIDDTDKITQYVNKIAQQIKILGLNANIEAARAGEKGRGFSVVAKEIQKLANDSESFAKEINTILVKLSDEIKKINAESDTLNDLSKVQITASKAVGKAINKLNEETNI